MTAQVRGEKGATKKIRVDAQKCTGCHLCEMACSLYHLDVVSIEKSAIRIFKDDLGKSVHVPKACPQCKRMVCLEGPQDAGVDEEEEKKKFVWPIERIKYCTPNALFTEGEYSYHCNLCGGDPQCIKVCTVDAIYVK